MPTMCPRCRGIDGAHFPWCTFASLFEKFLESPTQVVVPEAETAPPPVDNSEALAVYARRQDELTAELEATKLQRDRARVDRDTHARELGEARRALDELRQQVQHGQQSQEAQQLGAELVATREKLTEAIRERDLLRGRATQVVPGADRQEIERLTRQVADLQTKLNVAIKDRNVAQAALAARGPVKSQAEINRERAEEVRQAARRAQEHQRQQAEAQATEEQRAAAEKLAADRAEQAELCIRVRRERKWSQSQLAEALGVTGGMIGNVENRRSGFGPDTLRRLKGLAAPRVEIPTEPQALKEHVDRIAEQSQAVQQKLRDELDADTQARRAAVRAEKAAKPAPPESLEEAARTLPPTQAAPSQQGTAKEAKSREYADLEAASELFVAEHVVKTPGKRLKSADLQAAFAAWLPTVGFRQQHTADFAQHRQVGAAMGKAGYGKRQILDDETQTRPIYYLGASLAADVQPSPRESETKEGESPSAPPDHVAAITTMRRQARVGRGQQVAKATKPGKELKSEPIRKMAITLVETEGWAYEPAPGRGHPKVVAPDGRKFTLPTTPGDRHNVQVTKSKLRRHMRQELGLDDEYIRRVLP